jgi:hypothetical protein
LIMGIPDAKVTATLAAYRQRDAAAAMDEVRDPRDVPGCWPPSRRCWRAQVRWDAVAVLSLGRPLRALARPAGRLPAPWTVSRELLGLSLVKPDMSGESGRWTRGRCSRPRQ